MTESKSTMTLSAKLTYDKQGRVRFGKWVVLLGSKRNDYSSRDVMDILHQTRNLLVCVDGTIPADLPEALSTIDGPISLHQEKGSFDGLSFDNSKRQETIGGFYSKRLKSRIVIMKLSHVLRFTYKMSLFGPPKLGRRYNLIFAFPTLGKTTLAQKYDRFADIDVYYMNKALGNKWIRGKPYVSETYEFCAKIVNARVSRGRTVFTNDIEFLTQHLSIDPLRTIAVLPKTNGLGVAERMRLRDPNTSSFDEFRNNGDRYMQNWANKARELGIPLIRVEWLTDVIDPQVTSYTDQWSL